MKSITYTLAIGLTLLGVSMIFSSLAVAYLDSVGFWQYPKDFSQALFQSRISEPLGLGLGLQIFHYFLGGIVAAALGSILLATRRTIPQVPAAKPQAYPENLDDLKDRVRLLEHEKENLIIRLGKYERKPSMLASYLLLAVGTLALISATVSSSSIIAFIGLGLAFWGALLSYIRPAKYVKLSLLTSTAVPSLTALGKEIDKLGKEGKAVYLPPEHLSEIKGGKVSMTNERNTSTNSRESNLIPPGLSLTNLYEEELGMDFAKTDLAYLQRNLPRLLAEHLEIVDDLQMETEGNKIKVKITGSVYKDLCKELRRASPNICSSLGCPLVSSIALAITRAAGKPTIIEREGISSGGETIEADFTLLEKDEARRSRIS